MSTADIISCAVLTALGGFAIGLNLGLKWGINLCQLNHKTEGAGEMATPVPSEKGKENL